MAFFEAQARIVWFGHQQDDIAETMLMRLARGSGTGGLAAPRPVQIQSGGGVRLRPLLGLKKEEITAALRQTRSWSSCSVRRANCTAAFSLPALC
jgi:tRNA(Ile)-lysidine synthase